MQIRKISFKGIAGDSFLLAFVRIVTLFSGILQTKILSVGFSLQDYGTYTQANVVIALIASITILGMIDAVNYFYNKNHGAEGVTKRNTFINTIFLVETVVCIVVSAVVLLGKDLIVAYFSNAALKSLTWVIVLKPMLDNLVSLYQVLFVSAGKAKVIAFKNLIISVVKLAIIFCAVALLKNITAIYIFLMITSVLELAIFAFLFGHTDFYVNPAKSNTSYIKPILVYALPMGVFSLTNTLSREIGKLIVGYLTNTEQLAIYANCSRILPFDFLSVAFATVLVPFIMRYLTSGERDKAIFLFANYMKVGYYSVWSLGAAVLSVATTAVSFLYSDAYLVGTPVFIIFVVDSMVRFASMHLIITAAGKTKLLMLYSLLSLVVNAVLNVVLYYCMGIIGPAIATLLVSTGYALIILGTSKSILKAKWGELFDFKDMTVFLFQLAITVVLVATLNHYLLQWNINRYIAMIIAGGAFGITNLLLLLKRIKVTLQSINALKI